MDPPREPSDVAEDDINRARRKVAAMLRHYMSYPDLLVFAARGKGHAPRRGPQHWQPQSPEAEPMDVDDSASSGGQSSSGQAASGQPRSAAATGALESVAMDTLAAQSEAREPLENRATLDAKLAAHTALSASATPAPGEVQDSDCGSVEARKAMLAKKVLSKGGKLALKKYQHGSLSKRGLLLQIAQSNADAAPGQEEEDSKER